MATLYITSNANSGAGSLRALLASANAGDIIQPSSDVFPAGTVCEITLGANLIVSKGVTIRGAQTRIRITANGAAYAINVTAGLGSVVAFEDVEFAELRSDYYGGVLRVNGPDKVVCRRCLAVGNRGKYGGFAHVANGVNPNTALELYDSAFYGNYASTAAAFVYFQGPVYELARLENCTYGANVCAAGGGAFNHTPPSDRRPNVVTSASNWRTPPDASYSAETWTREAWRAMNPRPVAITTNAVESDSIFDLDGNFRRESVDGEGNVVGGALGAYELLDADLYWIGRDENGNEIASGSFAAPTGWASSLDAIACGAVAPSPGQTLYIAKSARFYDAPGSGSTLVVAPRVAVVVEVADELTANLALGLGASLDTVDKNYAIEAPIIKNAPYSQLLAPVQQLADYPAESLFMEGYVADFTVSASNLISCYPEYGKLVVFGCDEEELFHAIEGVFHARTIIMRSGASQGGKPWLLFDERLLEPVAAVPEFHCESFTAIDVEWRGDIQPVVYAKNLVTLDTVELQDSTSAPFVVDLSEADSGIELTLDKQEIRNLTVPVSLTGSAVINGGTFDSTLVFAPLRAFLVVKNCVVGGETLEVVDYDLTIIGGSFAPTSIVVRSTSNLLTPPTLTIDGVSGLSTLQSLAVVLAQFHLIGGAVTINDITTIGATIQFNDCAAISYSGVLNQTSLGLYNVTSAQLGTLVLTDFQAEESACAISGSLSADAVLVSDSTVEVGGAVSAPIVTLEDASTLSCASLTATSLDVGSSTLNFSGVAKGTTATFQASAINGGESSRLSFRTLRLIDSNVVAQTVCSMTATEYDALNLPDASSSLLCQNGSLSVNSLVVYEADAVQFGGSVAIESAAIRGTVEFLDAAQIRIDSLAVASSASLNFPETGNVVLFEVGSLALNTSATIEAETIRLSSMSLVDNLELNGDSVLLGDLFASDGVKVTARAEGRVAISASNDAELLLDVDADEIFSAYTLRLRDESVLKANEINVAGIRLASGLVAISNVERGARLGAVDAGNGTLTFDGAELIADSVVGEVALRATAIALESVELCDGDAIEGESIAISRLTSKASGSATIAGSTTITIGECAVANNLTIVGGAINGTLNATGYIHAEGSQVKANIGSGVTLECESLRCEEVRPTDKASAIVATALVHIDEITAFENLSLNAPVITSDSCLVHIDSALTLLAFQVASFGEASIYGRFVATGDELTTTNLVVDGEFTATLTDAFHSSSLSSQGTTTVQCATLDAGTLEINADRTAITATNAASVVDVAVAQNGTLFIAPPPPTLNSMIVSGTFQTIGPGAIQVANEVALNIVENDANAERVELLLTTSLDSDPTLVNDVVVRTINGTASDFYATITSANSVKFTWKAANGVPCTIEVQDGEDFYSVVTRSASLGYENGEYVGRYECGMANANGKKFRLYDGAKYLSDIALTAVAPSFYTCAERRVSSASRYGSIFFAARIVNQLTGEWLTSSDVIEARATLYKVTRKTVSSYQRTPVANWINVTIAPQFFDELERIPLFNDDFNFAWIPDQSQFVMTGAQGSFALAIRLKLTGDRNPVSLTFEFDVP